MTLMGYMGSEATRFDYDMMGATPQREGSSSLQSVRGGGADARARQGVSAQFVARFKYAMIAFVAIAALFVARVGVYSVAVGVLADNATMRTELKQTTNLTNDLRIQRSVLSSTQRIDRIATQSYGMVLATGAEQMSASSADEAASTEATAQDQADAEQASADVTAKQDAKLTSDEVASQIGDAEQTQGDGSSAGANAADVDSLA